MEVTHDRLVEDLVRFGIERGEWIFLHSSLKSVGWVEGGAETVIGAFREVIGPEGMLIVPTLSPTVVDPGGGRKAEPWHKEKTPSRVGKITDTLWRMRDAHRSDHPTHSVAAVGAEAARYVEGHHHSLPVFGLGSPYPRHVKRNALILFLGVSMGCNTTLHAFEEWIKLPYLGEADALVEGPGGEVLTVRVTGFPSGCRGFYGRNETHVSAYVREKGLVMEGRVGEARVTAVRALDLAQVMLDKLYEEPDFLLCRREGCAFCTEARRKIGESVEEIRARYPVLRGEGLYHGLRGR